MQPVQTSISTRRLLARVRDVMAGSASAQERLNEIVTIIAAEMTADVCSIYVRRAGDVLELFATQGLSPNAVHLTRLRVGEGLVGDIAASARPLAISDAQHHPQFAFRPETGEEIYQSLMGVPILRDGKVLGTLAIQKRDRYVFSDEETEVLQTVAMVLAELVAGGELIGRDELQPADGIGMLPLRIRGMRLNTGLAMGTAVLHQPEVRIAHLVGEDPDAEAERLDQAVADMHGALDRMFQDSLLPGHGEHRDVLEAYRMIAQDAGWLKRIRDAIATGLSAEASVKKVQGDLRVRMVQLTDPYLRERVHDFEDLANRLLQHLTGLATDAPQDLGDPPKEMILVARSMGPAQLLDYDLGRLRGLVLEEGSHTSHVAVIARALDIPVVGHARDILQRIEDGDLVIVDGDNAQIFLRPSEDIVETFHESVESRQQRNAAYATLRDLPAVTLDGESVSIHINVGLLADVQQLNDSGADGIGLYRTEVPFMVRSGFPDVEAQRELYAKVLDQAGEHPVVFRTLDAGGDKILPYWTTAPEENPAMGWRAIRVSLDRPAMLRQQFRALIRAAAGRDLKLMFPMVADVSEFEAAKALLNLELERERQREGREPQSLKIGAMLEVPSLAFQLPALLKKADFISVGSNDLLQFLFASDRGNPRLSDRYDPLSPLVLSFLKNVLAECRSARVPVSVCGEMAGRPLEAMALVAIGFRDLSVAPPATGPLKAMIRSLHFGELRRYMDYLYDLSDRSVREKLRSFARDHGVLI